MPAPPNTISSLRAGFDAVANQIAIILIPVTIDLFFWLGPHIRVKSLVNGFINSLNIPSDIGSIQSTEVLASSKEILQTAAEQFNLLSLLRTIPVGIPSLMAGRLPLQTPGGAPAFFDISNLFIVTGIVLGMIIIGLVIGCLYYILVGQIALQGKIDPKIIIKNWSWSSVQVLSLALALLLIFLLISIPSSCAISALTFLGLPLGQFAIFIYIGLLMWLVFPLLFSAHGIFVNHNNALVSVQRSMILTRMTLPSTSVFILSILVISEGLDILWRVPKETSWLTIFAVGGHAFISSALLAASFVYYRDADLWTQETLRMLKSQQKLPLKST
jgi:hypothetical protein